MTTPLAEAAQLCLSPAGGGTPVGHLAAACAVSSGALASRDHSAKLCTAG